MVSLVWGVGVVLDISVVGWVRLESCALVELCEVGLVIEPVEMVSENTESVALRVSVIVELVLSTFT